MRKYEIGDRVRVIKDSYKHEKCIIIATFYMNRKYHIKFLNLYNVQRTNLSSWVSENDIELDKEYYRDTKIDEILKDL